MIGCRPLEDEEIQVVLNDLKRRDKLLFLTCLTFGARISEALSLSFRDVNGRFLYLRSSKGSENQSYPIPDSYKQLVSKLRYEYESRGIKVVDSTRLFLSQKGNNQSITRQLASYILKRIAGEKGLDGKVNTHSLRKSFCSKVYEMTNYNLAETRLYSRHKTLVNLEYYLKTSESTDLVLKLGWV